jgi:hypothetical protein
MTPSATFTAMLELLSDESKWTQGAFARDADRRAVRSYNPTAICWCLSGALNKTGSAEGTWDFLRKAVGGFPTDFNDAPDRTFPEIRAAIERARDLALKEGK